MTDRLVARIWDRDHTVWQDDPDGVADRLGWLDCPTAMRDRVAEFTRVATGAFADRIDRVLLAGMGGSSLYPQVLAEVAGPSPHAATLTVLDSTHPDAVARARAEFDPARTLLVAASKSGGTIETRSHLERFWADLVDALGAREAGQHVVAVTDPGSSLAALGRERQFRAVVENPADIGGRFSALSAFGLLPAALLGLDVAAQLQAAAAMAADCRTRELADNPGVALGDFMAEAAAAGRHHLTVLLPEPLRAFGAWIEQLVAESTGKNGVGLLPIVDEPVLPAHEYGSRRSLVVYGRDHPELNALAAQGVPVCRLPTAEPSTLTAEVFRWEFATAVAGSRMGVNPFDQPDVQAAKTVSVRLLEDGTQPPPPRDAAALLERIEPGDALHVLAFVDPQGATAGRLAELAEKLRARYGVAVTVGIGPRYLHSTGQLHKGGPGAAVFAMLLEDGDTDVEIPGRDHTFGALLRAQAAGDLVALSNADRRAARVRPADLFAAAGLDC